MLSLGKIRTGTLYYLAVLRSIGKIGKWIGKWIEKYLYF